MLKYFSYSDEIVVFWDKSIDNVKFYVITVNGKKEGQSTKTFFRISGLRPNETYDVSVVAVLCDETDALVGNFKCRTKEQKRDVYVSAYPYYAVGDGKTLNTFAIQRAIDDCGENDRIVIPKGVFLTGALILKNNTELYIEEGGVLKGSTKKEDYLPKIRSRFEGKEYDCYSSLINVGTLNESRDPKEFGAVIRGKGAIIGGGIDLLYDCIGIEGKTVAEKRHKLFDYQNNLSADKDGKHRQRGRLINISCCKNVLIDGLNLSNSPSWNVHILYSENVITCGCKITSQGIWNGDGFDPDSSKNCSIFDCEFDTGDDCIAIKSGKNPEGNLIGKPTENINIFSCEIKKGRSHGVAIGSEVSGGINGVNIWDCDFSNSFFGIHIKTTKKRGGFVKNVEIKDSKISRVMIRRVDYNDDGEDGRALTEISGIKVKNTEIEYNSGDPNFGIEADSYIYVNGFSEDVCKVKNLEFDSVKINNKENLKEYDVQNCKNVFFNGEKII